MRYAFVAGVVVCVSLIPINRWLAQRIQAASQEMMGYKDARVRVMGECLKGMRGIKMMAWETVFVDKVWLVGYGCVHLPACSTAE